MALVCNPWLDRMAPLKVTTGWVIAGVSIATLVATLVFRDEGFRLTVRYTLQSLAIAALIYLAVARADSLPFRWLMARPLVYIGTISYTIYLSHHLILLGLVKHWPELSWLGLTLAGAAVTLFVAEPIRRWVEQPCAKLRQRLHRGTATRKSGPGIVAAGAR